MEVDLSPHVMAAESCHDFLMALIRAGFERREAHAIVVAWYGRSGTDMAAMNAMMLNFARELRGGD